MYLVGLTGGIASGKSSVVSMLRNKGIEVIDADIIAREVVQPGKTAWKKIREEFTESVFHDDGTLNREAMGKIVFSNADKRKRLNSITHPEIYKSLFWNCLKLFFCGHHFVVLDIPLLYESGKMVKYVHKTIVVTCEPSQQLHRLMLRDKISEEDALRRINAQMPLEKKEKMADFVMRNSGSKEETLSQVEEVVKKLRNLNTYWKYRVIILGCFTVTVTTFCLGFHFLYQYLCS